MKKESTEGHNTKMERIKSGMDFVSTGWRLVLSILLATIWVTIFLMNIKSDIKLLDAKVDGYQGVIEVLHKDHEHMHAELEKHTDKPAHDNHYKAHRDMESGGN